MNRHAIALILLATIVILGMIGALFALHDNDNASDSWKKYLKETTGDSTEAAPDQGAQQDSQQDTQRGKLEIQKEIIREEQEVKRQALFIISGAGTQFSENVSVAEQETVLNILQKLSDQGRITIQVNSSSLGAFIEELNGIKNNSRENMYWFLYQNGKSSNVGASTLVVQPNDTIEWRFEKAN